MFFIPLQSAVDINFFAADKPGFFRIYEAGYVSNFCPCSILHADVYFIFEQVLNILENVVVPLPSRRVAPRRATSASFRA